MFLTPLEGFGLIVMYGVIMGILVYVTRAKRASAEDFLVVNRQLGIFRGSFSIAAAWIWAPAVFICSLKSFTQGLPGIFWFTVPNILCFFTFTPLALRLRRLFPQGYTWPDYIWLRFGGDKRVHIVSLAVYFGYQMGAIIINCLAGGTLLSLLTGIDIRIAIVVVAAIALKYTLISGFRASVLTDVVHMIIILFIAIVLVPWIVYKAGGVGVIAAGLGGESGKFTNMFDPFVAYSFGIATTFGLISGPISDQMFFQRAFAARKNAIVGIFVFAAIITPPDVISQVGLAIPLLALYEVSIWSARSVEKKRAAREAAEEAELSGETPTGV